ncbi:MAG: hypothetical protein FWD49_00065 [Firmicutes bacterium]|nr:hypothetical protein [Bacillota bacterium]
MPKFKKCPRCEINYIPYETDYCEVCKLEMRGLNFHIDLDDEGEGELCPRCKQNYLGDGEKYCEHCADAIDKRKKTEVEEWEDTVTPAEDELLEGDPLDDDILPPDEVSLEEFKEEEESFEEEEFEDEENMESEIDPDLDLDGMDGLLDEDEDEDDDEDDFEDEEEED